MDDIYFTDKKSRRNGNDDKSKNDRFTRSEYHDISSNPNLKKRSSAPVVPPKKNSFTVNIPDGEFDVPEYQPERDRTPQGKRRVPAAPPSRTPSGIRVSDSVSLEYKKSTAPDRAPSAPRSRTPQKPPVAPKKKNKNAGPKIAIALFLVVLEVGS